MKNSTLQQAGLNTEAAELSIRIGIAETAQEKTEIYRFRYQTYVEEMSKHIKGIDHTKRLLCDDMDKWGILLYAKLGSELIGTARINIGEVADFPKDVASYLSLHTFQKWGKKPAHVSFITKIMVAPHHRNSPAFYLLIAKVYEHCCKYDVPFIFGICNYHLIRLYEKMGLRRYYKNFEMPGYGLQSPIILLTNDILHLRQVHSPLYRIARKRIVAETASVEWFHETFSKHSSIINSQLISEDDLWRLLSERLGTSPTKAISLLSDLPESEAKKLIHLSSSIIPCHPGDILVNQGDVSYTYQVLISGALKSLTFYHPVKDYTLPGQAFGANGLTEHNKHGEDIAAVDFSEILVFSGIAFQKFFHAYPEIAHKIVRKAASLTRSKLLKINN